MAQALNAGGVRVRATVKPPRADRPSAGPWWALLLLLGAGALLLADALFSSRVLSQADSLLQFQPWSEVAPPEFQPGNPLLDDQVSVMLPWLDYAAERVGAGEFPLWNPYNYLGQPIHAANTGAFLWPPHLAYYAWPTPAWYEWMALGRIVLAGLATWLFLTRIGLRSGAACTGAVAYALGGFLIAWLNHPHANVAPFLPLLLWLVERAAARPGSGAAAAIALATGAQFLGGHVQTSLHVGLAVGAWCALRCALPLAGRRLGLKGLASAALGAVAGGLLAAPQLLPLAEYLEESQAAALFDELDVTSEVELSEAASFLVHPDRFGRPDRANYSGPEGDNLNYNELVGVFVGRIALVLALAQLWLGRRDRRTWVFAGLALLALGVAWQIAPLYEAARSLPVVRSTKLMRLGMVSSLALACLAALGVQSIAARLDARRGALFSAATALFCALELVSWGRGYNPAIEPELVAPQTEFVRALAQDTSSPPPRVLGVDNTFLRPNANLFHRIAVLSGYDSIEARRTVELVGLLTHDERAAYFIKEIRSFDRLEALPLAQLLGVRYLCSEQAVPLPLEARRFGALHVYELPGALPRAFLARSVEVVPDAEQRLARLGAPDFDPWVALLEEAPPSLPAPAPRAPEDVRILEYEPQSVRLAAQLAQPGLLVLADAWDPGWRVRVDGEEQAVLRVDHALRGVLLEAGEHEVVWEYAPRSFGRGWALAGLAAALLGAAWVLERRRLQRS